MKKLSVMCVAMMALLSTQAVVAETLPQVQKVAQTKKAKGIWIDVRTAEEFKTGHIQGALNIPVEQLKQKINQISSNKNAPIHLYCRSGRRAEVAAQTLREMGYTNVVNHGGYQDLLQRGIR